MKVILRNLQVFLICTFAFLIILKASFAIIALIALVTVVVVGCYKTILPNLIKSPVALMFLAYYAWHATGMLWSSNTEYGFMDLEMKLSFIVFPLIFSSIDITSALRKKGLLSFIAGCFVLCFYLLYRSYINYQNTQDAQAFLYAGFSRFIHPTYLTMYLNVTLIILLGFIKPYSTNKALILILAGILFLIFIVMMLSARMAIITSVVTGSITIFFKMDSYHLKKRIVYFLLFIAVCSAAFYITNKYYNRLEQVENAVTNFEENKPETHTEYNSATSRPELWKEALEVIFQHPIFGVGTGDVKDELIERYNSHHFGYALERKLNPHNQFLHTAVGLGLVGLILLLLCMGIQFYFAFFNKDWLYFCFLVIIVMNALTESNLEVQSGILLFNFFSMFFYSSLKNRSFEGSNSTLS